MRLGEFHKLIALKRKDKSIHEAVFIKMLTDVARVTVEHVGMKSEESLSDIINNESRLNKNAFSTNYKRTPLANVHARAILIQKNERFRLVMEFFLNNLSKSKNNEENALYDILNQILSTDHISIKNILSSSRYLSEQKSFFCNDNDNTDYKSLTDKEAAYVVTEYYYYLVFWNIIDFSIFGIDNIQTPFKLNLDYNIRYNNRTLYSHIVLSNQLLLFYNNMSFHFVKIMNNFYEKSIEYNLPLLKSKSEEDCMSYPCINNPIFISSKTFFCFFYNNFFLIYQYGISNIVLCVNIPISQSDTHKLFYQISDDDIIEVFTPYYKICIDIRNALNNRYSLEKKQKTVHDYIEDLSVTFQNQILCKANTKNLVYINTDAGIKKIGLNGISEDKFIFEFAKKGNYSFDKVLVSNNEEFILLEESCNNGTYLIDINNKYSLEIVKPYRNNCPDYITKILDESKCERLTSYMFSPDNTYFAYSTSSKDRVVTTIINLSMWSEVKRIDNEQFMMFSEDSKYFYTQKNGTEDLLTIVPYSTFADDTIIEQEPIKICLTYTAEQ